MKNIITIFLLALGLTAAAQPGAITGTPTVCRGFTTALTDATAGGAWRSDNTGVATVGSATGVVTGVAAGTATVSYTVAGVPATLVVTVNRTPPQIYSLYYTLCVGSSILLTDSIPGGTWSSSNTAVETIGSSSGIITGVSAGTSHITYTAPTGCYYQGIMTSYALPAPIAGNGHLCPGGTLALTDASTGGGWSVSMFSSVVSVGGGSGVVTGIAAGTAVISYGIIAPCYVSTVVTVSLPATAGIISGPHDVTLGLSVTLTDYVTGGTWSSSNPSLASIDPASGLVTGLVTGTVVMSYTATNSCGTTDTTMIMTVNTPFVDPITGPTFICSGSSVPYSDATAGGAWTSSNTAVATVGTSSGIVTGVSQGTTTLSYSAGGGTTLYLINVYSAPAPIIGQTHYCPNFQTASFTDAIPGGIWHSSNTTLIPIDTFTAIGHVWAFDTMTVPVFVTISYTTACGVATTVVSVYPTPPEPTIPNVICGGSSYTFTDVLPGGTWSCDPIGGTIDPVTGAATVYDTDEYDVYYTATYGCTIGLDVNVLPAVLPITAGPTSICTGAMVLMSDVDGLSITTFGPPSWISGNPGVATVNTTGAVTGVSAGTTIITFQESPIGIGCSAMLTVTVSSTIAGSSGTITGTGAICPGLTLALTDPVGGGGWSSGSPGLATVDPGGVVTAVMPGTATISYILTDACGSEIATTIVTVNGTSPGTITGPSTVCGSFGTSLADPATGGTWSSGSPGVASVGATGVVHLISVGTATISYTVNGSCGPLSATHLVTTSPLPVADPITGTLGVCVGGTTALSDGIAGGVWSSLSPAIASIGSSGLVTGLSPGTAYVVYTTTNICSSAVVTKMVTVNTCTAGTITGVLTVCAGGTTSLTDLTSGGNWSSGSPGIATVGSTGIVTGVTPGTAIISYTVGASSATAVVTVNAAGSAGTISGVTQLCLGGTTALTDGVAGGVWSTGASNVSVDGSGDVLGIAYGVATISYTVSGACGSATATLVVTVSPGVTAGVITGGTLVCSSGTSQLTDAVSGGVWSSGTPGVATVGASGLVSGVSLGTATISYTVSNSCGSSTATLVVTVSTGVSAGTITGTAIVCTGSTTNLTDAVGGGSWSSSNTLIASVSTAGVVVGLATGTAIIYYTVSNSCGTVSANRVVTVNPSPSAGTITGTAVLCSSGTTTLSDAAAGGTWSSVTPAVATIGSTGFVTGVSAGTTIVSYSVTNSCGTTVAATRVVTVNGAPNAGTITGTTTVCGGATTALTDAVTGGAWSSGTPAVATVSATGLVTGVSFGTTTISYTVTNSCGTATATTVVNVSGSSAGTITGASTVITGTSISLTDAVSGGSWTASNGNATVSAFGLVTGVTPGTVTISYTVVSGCGSLTTTKVITVSNATSVSPISGYYFYMCTGATAAFWDATTGGSWNISPTSVAIISAAGVATGMSAGTATISYTYGGSTVTAVVTVYATPSAITGANTICSGTTTVLSDATPGGTWSSSAVTIATISTAGLVTGGSTGTTTIYYTGAAGCRSSMVLTVTAAPSGIGGATSVCAGSSISLSDFTLGGTWSSTSGASVAATGSTTALATGITAGTATVTYSLGGSCYRTFNITVKVTPAPISGTLTVCTGSKVFLSDITTPGISWTSGSAAVATITASGAVTGVTVGTAIMTYMASSGCIATAVVTVNPTPTITAILGASSVSHSGGGITLSDLTGGGVWSSSNTAILTVGSASGHVTAVVSTGSAYINYIVTNSFGCSAAASKIISTSPAPHAHGSATTVGATVALADEIAAGDWTSTDNTIATVGNGIVTALAAGTVNIIHTNGDVTTVTELLVNPLPLEVRLVPNPNKGTFTITGTVGTNKDESVSIEITNMLGQIVYHNSTIATGGVIADHVLLSDNLANGMYLLNVKSGSESKILHFVIEK